MHGIGFSSTNSSIGSEPLSRVPVTAGTESSTSTGSTATESGGESTAHFPPVADPDPVIKFTAMEAKAQAATSLPPGGSNPPGKIDFGGGSGDGGVGSQSSAELVGSSMTLAVQNGEESTAMIASETESALSTRIDLMA